MIKIVHVITDLGAGGAQQMLVRIATGADRTRFEHVVVSLVDDDVYGACLREAGIRVKTLGMKRGIGDLLLMNRLRRFLREERPDIVQTWLYHADLVGLIAGRLAGIRTIGWNVRCSDMHLEHYRLATRIVRWTLARCSRLPSFVVSNSYAGQAFHERIGYRPRRWKTIANGFDLNVYKPQPDTRAAVRRSLGISEDVIAIGIFARFDAMKDHETFVRAAGMTKDVQFLMAGSDVDANNATLRRWIDEAGIADRTHLLGFRTDVPRLLNACDVVVLSSAFGEGFPNVLGEAMSSGVPCVATDVGDSALVIGDTGRIVAPRDPDALSAAMRELASLGHAGLRALGARARERIRQQFDISSIVRQYESMYESPLH